MLGNTGILQLLALLLGHEGRAQQWEVRVWVEIKYPELHGISRGGQVPGGGGQSRGLTERRVKTERKIHAVKVKKQKRWENDTHKGERYQRQIYYRHSIALGRSAY